MALYVTAESWGEFVRRTIATEISYDNVLDKSERLLHGRPSIGRWDTRRWDEIVAFRRVCKQLPSQKEGRKGGLRVEERISGWLASVAKVGASVRANIECIVLTGAPPRCSSRFQSVFSESSGWIYEFTVTLVGGRLIGREGKWKAGRVCRPSVSRKTGPPGDNCCNFPNLNSKVSVFLAWKLSPNRHNPLTIMIH